MTKKNTQLLIRLSEDELNKIQDNAKAMDKTVSAYVRYIAKDFCILNCNYESIVEHTHEITALRNAINQLVYTIKKTGEYVPADLEYILERMKEISKSENEFLNLMINDRDTKTKVIARETRKIVRRKLEQNAKKQKFK